MKSIVSASIGLLIASAAAAPSQLRHSKRQIGAAGVGPVCTLTAAPTAAEVLAALQTWNTEVTSVNTFLDGVLTDSAAGLVGTGSLTATALNFAMDEPTELNILACIPGQSQTYQNAATGAAAGFMIDVLMPLMDISVNGASSAEVIGDAGIINAFRCCTLAAESGCALGRCCRS